MELFVSDLDGTLLNQQQELSAFTIETINRLIHSGMQFSVATARSIVSAKKIIEPLDLRLPVIVHNGVFICDPVSGKNIRSRLTSHEDALAILDAFNSLGVLPMLYTINENGDYKVYYTGIRNKGQEDYVRNRQENGDKRLALIEDFNQAIGEDIITIIAIDSEDRLRPAYEALKRRDGICMNFSEDIYSHFFWLEITHRMANKKDAVLALKELSGADRIVAFGDNMNDIPMFEASDLSLAVKNAYDQVKQAASRVIGGNGEDGVVKFLEAYHGNIGGV